MDSDQLLTKSLGEEFKCIGEWWIPSDSDPLKPEFKHCGILTFSRGNGIQLDVMGQLAKNVPPEDLFSRPIGIIWGMSSEAELITLVNCQNVGTSIGTVWTESYSVYEVYVSKHAWLTPGEDIRFKSLNLQYTHLAEWVGIGGFHVPTIESLDKLVKAEKAQITYKRPKDLQTINVKGYSISIAFGYSWPGVSPATQKATIEQRTSIHVEPQKPQEIPLDDAHTVARCIQNFLSLVMYDEPSYPLVIEGEMGVKGKDTTEERYITMRLLYEPTYTRKPSEAINRRKILFTYNDVAKIWEGALDKLLTTEGDKLKPAFNEFFAEYFVPPKYSEDRFVATVRAIEAFHRETTNRNYYVPKEDYANTLLKKFNEQIDEARHRGDIDQDFQKHLKKKLSNAYQYSLGKRFDDLFELYGWKLFAPFAQKGKNEFIDEVVATSNWLTNFNEEDQDKALNSGAELAYLNLKLQLFMITLLLRYIGIPSDDIEDVFKHYKFSYLRKKPEKSGN